MESWMAFCAMVLAVIGQALNAKPNIPVMAVKLALAGAGVVLYLMIAQPGGMPGSPAFLEWFNKAWLWALALPGAASLIGLADGMRTNHGSPAPPTA